MKEGGTSLNKTFREYNLVFKGLNMASYIGSYNYDVDKILSVKY